MIKILIITPVLVSDSIRSFLFKKVTILSRKYSVKLIEFNDFSDIISEIVELKPDIIHFEEFPENFLPNEITEQIFGDLKNQLNYKITETTHVLDFDKSDKKFKPDKTIFNSKMNYTQYFDLTNHSEVIEYNFNKNGRYEKLISLDLDPNYIHVLNVDTFNKFKNQSEIFEYAKKLENKNIKFHFLGSLSERMKDYWEPLLIEKPSNCIIWQNESDFSKFYSSMDLLISTSKLENRPHYVFDAISNGIKVMMYYLANYGNDFSKFDIQWLTSDLDYNLQMIEKTLNLKETSETNLDKLIKVEDEKNEQKLKTSRKISAYHMLTDIDSEREVLSMISLSQLKRWGVEYKTCINKRYTELPPAETCEYPEKISFEPGGKLTPGHYGCYLAHKEAFYRGIQSDSDFIFIFECDAVIHIPIEEFIEKVEFACDLLDKTDLLMFSFGFHNHVHIIDKFSDYWTVNKFYGAHAYLIPRRSFENIKHMYETSKWNVADLLFVEKLDQYKTGIFEFPPTKQAAGYSILDKIYNEDRH